MAHERRKEARKLLANGADPATVKKAQKAKARERTANKLSFVNRRLTNRTPQLDNFCYTSYVFCFHWYGERGIMFGLSTYAFFWQISERAPTPPGLEELFLRTRELGAQVFQVYDYAPLQTYSNARLVDLKKSAKDQGITLELGTKGIQSEHLANYLRMADLLEARLVRSMVNAPDHRPSLVEAERLLRASLPAYEASGVTLALETYEQLSSTELVALVESVGSQALGICLDPANCVASLEHPIAVIDRCAPYVVNVHVKNFAFTRREGWVGFLLEGVELGKGLLPYDYMIEKIDPAARGINQVIEHWLSWQENYEKTACAENAWNAKNLAHMGCN